jgi:phage terminase large subunit-like protein
MSAEPFDPSEFQQWDPKTQHIAAEAVRRRIEGNIRAWFCVSPGRACDGKPHEGYPYKHARADQWPPPGEDWAVWAVLSGRGAGKTRTGSEWVRKMSERVPAVGLIGRRGVDVRDTMVEGVGEDPENGAGLILACERAGVPYLWEPSKKLFTFGNGCVAIGFSGEEPDSLRGKNLKAAWLDEPAHMPLIDDVWKMLRLTMRQKGAPGTGRAKILVTTTPLPTKWIKELIVRPTTRVTRVSTYMNIDNLDEAFQEEVLHDMEGTRLGRQEIHGEVLEDIEGALWQAAWIEDNRDNEFDRTITVPERIVVGVDPAGTATKRSDETGIVVVGKIGDHFYVLSDGSDKLTPEKWANKTIALYEQYEADKIIAEKNYGGLMVSSTLQTVAPNIVPKLVNSRRGKELRAEPIAALYEQGRVHHTANLSALETQMCEWVPGKGDSPDRVDALVHAITELMGRGGAGEVAAPTGPLHATPQGGAFVPPGRR